MYNPIDIAKEIEQKITDGIKRRYYRLVRGGMWYGGIATADCCGCNLKCVFCWSNFPRDYPDKCGKFYTPQEVFNALISCAKLNGYHQIRISGNEITIAKEHMFELLKLVDSTNYRFIIETNGTLIDRYCAKELSKFKNIYVRISFKGTNREEFSKLTGSIPEGFDFQLNALENLVYYGVPCWPCVVISFTTKENFEKFKKVILSIHHKLVNEIETETIFLLPHIKRRLKEKNLYPLIYEDMKTAKEKECNDINI